MYTGECVCYYVRTVQSSPKVIASSVKSPQTLSETYSYFDVERVDVVLGHNVECRGPTSRLPILVLECSKRIKIWLYQGEKVDEIAQNFHGAILPPRPAISRGFTFPFLLEPCASTQSPMSGSRLL